MFVCICQLKGRVAKVSNLFSNEAMWVAASAAVGSSKQQHLPEYSRCSCKSDHIDDSVRRGSKGVEKTEQMHVGVSWSR